MLRRLHAASTPRVMMYSASCPSGDSGGSIRQQTAPTTTPSTYTDERGQHRKLRCRGEAVITGSFALMRNYEMPNNEGRIEAVAKTHVFDNHDGDLLLTVQQTAGALIHDNWM